MMPFPPSGSASRSRRRACLSIALFAITSAGLSWFMAPSAKAQGSTPPWPAIAASAQAFVDRESPPGVLPFDTSEGNGNRLVFFHYFPQWLLSLDNKPLNADFWSLPGKLVPRHPDPAARAEDFINSRPIAFNQRPISPDPAPDPFWRERNFAIDVLRARRIGGDGFLLDLPQINEGNLWKDSVSLCEVASHVAPGFRIGFEPGAAGLAAAHVPAEALVQALLTLNACPAAYHLPDGRLVVAPFAADNEPAEFWRAVFAGLSAKGIKVAFVPVILDPSPEHLRKLEPLAYELTSWGWSEARQASGATGRRDRQALSAHFPTWMAPVRSQDVRPKQGIFAEAENTLLFRQNWIAAIQDPKVREVQVITWNDLGEGSEVEPATSTQFLFHDLSAYYASWFKSGHPPPVRADAIYYCSRTQDMNAAFEPSKGERYGGMPVQGHIGPMKLLGQASVANQIEMLAFLTAPAQLEISVGGRSYTKESGAGFAVFNAPASIGRPVLRILRGGQTVVQVEAQYDILANASVPNPFYFGGSSNRVPVLPQAPSAQ